MISEIKAIITQLISEEEDEKILQAVYTILNRSRVEAKTRTEMYARALRSEEDIKAGRVYTLEEAKARISHKFDK